MDTTTFWNLMERTKSTAHADRDAQAKVLIQELAQLSEDDIMAFDHIFTELMDRAYRQDLWAAAFIINCGCSDDGFMDFRAWLIGQGRATYAKVLEDPEVLVDIVIQPYLTQPLSLFAVADEAYRLKTKQDMLPVYHDLPELIGEPWAEDTLSLKYPKLYQRFGDCADVFGG